MEAVILTVLGLMGTWNVAVMFWVLRRARNNSMPGNPHPLPCKEHRNSLTRIETSIETARKEALKSHEEMRHDLTGTQKTVTILWHDAYPGQSEPNKR